MLSHTAFPKFTFKDLTDEITPIKNTLEEPDIDLYTGYPDSFLQLELVESFIDTFKKNGCFVLIDSVMAHNGKLTVSYHGTGDIYASAALGAIMRGISIEKSLSIAVDFTLECTKKPNVTRTTASTV